MDKFTVLFSLKKNIVLMYTMYPFWVSPNKNKFTFTTDENWVLYKDTNKTLLIVGLFKIKNDVEEQIEFLEKLRLKYDKLIYFDDNDGSESHFLHLLNYFDLYFKKQIFSNIQLYKTNFYGNRIYGEYYHKSFGVNEAPLPDPLPKLKDPKDLSKIKVFWNLAFGQYPVSINKTKAAKKFYPFFGASVMELLSTKFPERSVPQPSLAMCHARFSSNGYRDSVGFQRKLFLEKIENNKLFLQGRIKPRQYNEEVKKVQAILSPFGWGEICFRDMEAIFNGAILIKPQMDHIETWPNLFVPEETYLPVKWDGTDLVETVDNLLSDPARMKEIRVNAWNNLKNAYSQLDNRLLSIVEEINSL
jgi:hypothetical protein